MKMFGQFALFVNNVVIFCYSSSTKVYILCTDFGTLPDHLDHFLTHHFTRILCTTCFMRICFALITSWRTMTIELESSIFLLDANVLGGIINPVDRIHENLEIVTSCDSEWTWKLANSAYSAVAMIRKVIYWYFVTW